MTKILVTGGAKGVGAAIVRALAAAGHDVDFTYRSSAEQAKALAQEIAASHPGRAITALPLDLSDKEALDAFQLLCRTEGIIPALEPSHALAHIAKIAPSLPKDHLMVVNLSGRGDKDIFTVAKHLGVKVDAGG